MVEITLRTPGHGQQADGLLKFVSLFSITGASEMASLKPIAEAWDEMKAREAKMLIFNGIFIIYL